MSILLRSRALADVCITGELCRLRPLAIEDAERAFAMLHDRREILDWLVWQGPRTQDDLVDHYRHWRTESEVGASHHLAIAHLGSDTLCGSISLRPREEHAIGELGYWVAVEEWGKGIGTEAVRLTCHLAFHDLGFARLSADVFDGNERSSHVLRTIGFTCSPMVKPFTCPDGRSVLEWTWELAREDFEARQPSWRPRSEHVRMA